VDERGDHRRAKDDAQDIEDAPAKAHGQLSRTMRGIASFSIAPAVAPSGES